MCVCVCVCVTGNQKVHVCFVKSSTCFLWYNDNISKVKS